jgi:hypothetical protein
MKKYFVAIVWVFVSSITNACQRGNAQSLFARWHRYKKYTYRAGGWWLVAGGWWLVAGGWWLVAGGYSAEGGEQCVSKWDNNATVISILRTESNKFHDLKVRQEINTWVSRVKKPAALKA